jgi:hypothetical protein
MGIGRVSCGVQARAAARFARRASASQNANPASRQLDGKRPSN